VKHKGAVLFWVDVVSGLLLLGLMLTGAVLHWVLPHGGEGGRHGQRARDAIFLQLSRHEWGDVHVWISLAFVAAMAAHLLLHTGWIVAACRRHLLGGCRANVPSRQT
jgi:hypothetical protein